MLLVDADPQRDAALGGEFAGIGQQVDQNLRQAVGVGSEHERIDIAIEAPLDTLLTRMGRGHQHMLADLHDLLRSIVEPDLAAFERRNVENVVQQREQHLGVVHHDSAVLGALLLRQLLALHERREAHDGVERRADLVAHVGQKRRFEHVRLLGLLAGDDQLLLALLERPLEPLHAQQQPCHEQQQYDQQQDTQHEQFDVVGVFRELGGHRIFHDAAFRKGVFGDLPVLELARIEEVDVLAGMELHALDPPGVVVLLDLGGNQRGPALILGDIAADGHVADARAGDRKDRDTGVALNQIVQRTLHEILPVAAHAPCAEHHGRTGRQRGVGLVHRLVTVAAVHEDQIQIGIVLPLLAHESLQRNAAVGVVRNESDVLHLRIERTDQVDVAADVVAVEHAAHRLQTVGHALILDRTGLPRLERIGRRRQHDAVRTGETAETHDSLGNAAQRHERGPRLLPQQHDGPQRTVLVTRDHIVDQRHPQRSIGNTLALERFDIDVARYVRGQYLLFEFGDETRHATRIGIVRRDDQDAFAARRLLRTNEQGRQQHAEAQQHPARFDHVVSVHRFIFTSRRKWPVSGFSARRDRPEDYHIRPFIAHFRFAATPDEKHFLENGARGLAQKYQKFRK